MLGVRARWQNRGLGRRMKLHQRDWALARGYDLIKWTFDPLQTRNAHLNIVRLGVVAREYLVDFYGPSGSRYNRGVGSDRIVAEWWIRSPRVRARIAGRAPLSLAESRARPHVEVPPDIDRIKARSAREARAWRRRTREAFQDFFRRGLILMDFVRAEPYCLYVFDRADPLRRSS
jgi:predicted GNAT superfamily acetyltransferase